MRRRVKEWLLGKKGKDPPDKLGKWKTRSVVPELNAAMGLMKKIKIEFENEIRMAGEMCELKFRIFILHHIISDQLSKCEMAAKNVSSANLSSENGEAKERSRNGSGSSLPETTPKRKPQAARYCTVEGCKFECKHKKKMDEHMKTHEEEPNNSMAQSESVNTTMFVNGLDSPSKSSTQTPITATPAQSPLGKPGKRNRRGSSGEYPTNIVTKAAKIQLDETTDRSLNDDAVTNEELVALGDSAEMMNMIKLKASMGTNDTTMYQSMTQETELGIGGTRELSPEPEKPKKEGKDFDESELLLAEAGEYEEVFEEEEKENFITPHETMSDMDQVNNNTMELEDYDAAKMEQLQTALANSRSREEEMTTELAGEKLKNQKLSDLLDQKEKIIKELRELVIKRDMKSLELNESLKKVNEELKKEKVTNEEWKKVGKEYLNGTGTNKAEVKKLTAKVEKLTKNFNDMTIQKDRAVEMAKNQKELYEKTERALTKEMGDHAKTKRRIPCHKEKCEDQKSCPWGHKQTGSTQKRRKCDFYQPSSGRGCRNGEDCTFVHETPNQAPNTQATPKTNNKNQNKIKNIPPKIEVSLPEPSPILANNNVVQEFSQSTPNAEAEESVMEVDESEVKVVGAKTTSREEDYRSCQEYVQRQIRVKNLPRNSPTPDERGHQEPPVASTSGLQAPPNRVVQGVKKYEEASVETSLKVPRTNQTPSPGVSPMPSMDWNNQHHMVRINTPDLVNVMSPRTQDLNQAGLTQMPGGGIYVSPLSKEYQTMVDNLIRKGREEAEAQEKARIQAQLKAEAEAKAKMEAETIMRNHMEARAMVEAQARLEAEARARAQAQAQAQAAGPSQAQQETRQGASHVMNQEEMMATIRRLEEQVQMQRQAQQTDYKFKF